MLSVQNLYVRYGAITALRGVSIEAQAGETVLLLGANGAGKSSLINAIMGVVRPTEGQIVFDGRNLGGSPAEARSHFGIGYSPEGRRLFSSMSVIDNVMAGALGRDPNTRRRRLEWVMNTFPLLAQRASQPAGQLSGGEQQIVAIARAVSASPKLLLLDEPFLGLAPVWISRISEVIRELQREGTTIVMTEQMARPALKLADRGYVMRGGAVRREGTIQEIRELALEEEYL